MIDTATGKAEEELDFVICQCHKYSNPDHRLNVYLLNDEPELAKTILSALQTYLEKFEADYGVYPYDQFSVVESTEEVGFAFPKMTWIGSQLLHFPFILQTSLPHELLHSWWGNGVFVDYTKGNWCEGFTTFGADYGLISDADKKIYRLKAITSYLDYAHTGKEISLSQFISRGEDRSLQAIGYDKSMMVLVMAEQRVGEKIFKLALKEFYGKFRYRKAAYQDFFSILSLLSGVDFTAFQNFWLYSVGILPKDFVQLDWQNQSNQLVATAEKMALSKIPGQYLPMQLQFTDHSSQILYLKVNAEGTDIQMSPLKLTSQPEFYFFDQDFLLFRDLNENEKPVTFSTAFSATELKLFSNDSELLKAMEIAFPSTKISFTDDTFNLKPDFSIRQIILVDSNHANLIAEISTFLKEKNIFISDDHFSLSDKNFSTKDHSFFTSFKIQQTTIIVFGLGLTQTQLRWLQRWGHYGAKSYVVLNSTGAEAQGLWLEAYKHYFTF